jgi:hypothetical protein
LLLIFASCSFLYDFNDLSGLPCDPSHQCDPNHVCLVPSNTCFPRHGVDSGKSCDIGAENPDDLCPANHVCESVNSQGKRCLPICTPSDYGTPEASANIHAQCAFGTTCWSITRGGGVCSEGVCNDMPNDCPADQQCVRFNGAGVCFTPCEIFKSSPCGGTQICQPVGDSSITACIPSGNIALGQICDDHNMCTQSDMAGRPLVCDRPQNSSDITLRHCFAICQCSPGTDQVQCDASRCNTMAPCVLARPNVDPSTMVGLGLCEETQ